MSLKLALKIETSLKSVMQTPKGIELTSNLRDFYTLLRIEE